VVVKE